MSATSCFDLIQKAGEATSSGMDSSESTSASNYVTVGVDGSFQVDLPRHMKSTSELNDEAVLQYANIFKDTYFIVIQENKSEYVELFKQFGEYNTELSVIENYKNSQKELFKEGIVNARIQEYGLNSINNYAARQLKVLGEVDGTQIAYVVAFIEGDDDIFMLMNWTAKEKFNKFENSFEYINGTFKLMDL
ncbi:hypothetical protein [Gaetbulibacter jejuensis]|uniref:hypothetical protein n=1 Tax=Gaetbulibacter jejuensis TaxID=584607 RepID=UPI0031D635CC